MIAYILICYVLYPQFTFTTMLDYCVVLFDDGVYHCTEKRNVRCSGENISAKWKSSWYGATLIYTGTRLICNEIIKKLAEEREKSNEEFTLAQNIEERTDMKISHKIITGDYTSEKNVDVTELGECSMNGSDQERYAGSEWNEDDDDSVADPNYIPEDDVDVLENYTVNIEQCDVNEVLSTPENDEDYVVDDYSDPIETESLETLDTDIIRVDNRKMDVFVSKSHCKRYFCLYCNKLVTNFGRHVLCVHTDKKEVKDILDFPKGHPERRRKIEVIMAEAQFRHNTESELNTGSIIVKRRPSSRKHRTASHYIPCSSCKQMFSKLSLRAHFSKCNSSKVHGQRDALLSSKRLHMTIHKKASTHLARDILSRSTNDVITSILLFDELCILYGNKLAKRYRGDQDSSMIRTRLREIGRFIQEFRKINSNVKNLKDILDPNNYDQIVESINKVAGLDESTGRYKAPSTAYNLGLNLKSITLLLETECIKEKNVAKRESVRDLLCLIRNGFNTDINRTVSENQSEQKRHKRIKLPTAEDINALKSFLKNRCREAYESLKKSYSSKAWKNLAGLTLISLQLFNRRRAGELERILIEDYKAYEFVDEGDQVFKGLSDIEKSVAKYYARFFIRGKLNRQVPVIIGRELIEYLDLILKHRNQYGVHISNPYVFGIPSKMHNKYLRACVLMRNYSKACGAPNPDTLRGTELRKQIATACALYNLSDPLVEDVANHLGHHIDIHKKIYRQSTAREVPSIVNILLRALGDVEDDVENSTEKPDSSQYLEIPESLRLSTDSVMSALESEPVNTDSTINGSESLLVNGETPRSSLQLPCGTSSTNRQDRVSWTTPEKVAVRNDFGHLISAGIVPTYTECIEIRERNSCLKTRTPPQIKSFVAYEVKKLLTPKTKDTGKKTWSTAEKQVVRTEFKENLEKQNLPSLTKCKQVIASNPILSSRNPIVLKAYVNNLNQKAKRESTNPFKIN